MKYCELGSLKVFGKERKRDYTRILPSYGSPNCKRDEIFEPAQGKPPNLLKNKVKLLIEFSPDYSQ